MDPGELAASERLKTVDKAILQRIADLGHKIEETPQSLFLQIDGVTIRFRVSMEERKRAIRLRVVLHGLYETRQFPEPKAGFDASSVDRIARAIIEDVDDRVREREQAKKIGQRVRETTAIVDRLNGERISKAAHAICSPDGDLLLRCNHPLNEQQARQILQAIAKVMGQA